MYNVLKIRAERLNKKKLDKKWTLDYVGKCLGLSKQYVYDIETGRRNPSYDVLKKLENLYGLQHNLLFSCIDDSITKNTENSNRN